MATVKAVYNYSYDYEGTKITFKKGEQFQLLSKANRDWWQVRRWKEGSAQDIYVPAVYVKEVAEQKKAEDPLYENIADLAKKVKQNGDATAMDDGHQYALPALKPKPKRESSKDKNDSITSPLHQSHRPKLTTSNSVEATASKTNGFVPKEQPASAEEASESTSPTQQPKRNKSAKESSPPVVVTSSAPPTQQKPGIKEGWMPTYALPPVSPKLRSKSLNTGDDQVTESSLDRYPRSSSPAQGSGGGKGRVPPPVLPKIKSTRPKSMVNTSQEQPENLGSESSDVSSTFLQPGAARHPAMRQEQEKLGDGKLVSEPPRIRKTPSPRTSLDENMLCKRSSASSLQSNGSLPQDSTSPSSTMSHLPEGWSEHKTNDGRFYYHNSLTGQSSWTRPLEEPPSTSSTSSPNTPSHQASLLERVAPKGYTKETNTFTSTPIFTNCRTGERWALAKDGSGNFYYYNMANSSLTVGELPAIDDAPSSVSCSISDPASNHQEILYDRLNPLPSGDSEARPQTSLEENPSPKHQPAWPSQPAVSAITSQLEMFASSMSNVLKKHGYLTRKKLHDPQGKRVKGSWQKLYVILQESQLFFYTDHKAAKEQPGAKPLSVFPLLQAVVSPYNKEKKKFVFQVSSIFGEQFLLQAETSPLMNDWYSTIQTAINNVNQDFKDHPERYNQLLMEGDGEQSPRFSSRVSGHKRKESKDFNLDAELEYDPMDDPEISAADKSVRIRSRLKKLMDKRPKIETLKKSGIIEDPVFGCELGKLWEQENGNMPRFLTQFMDHIEQHGLDVVGIYRLSGNAASVQKLRFLVEQDQTINLNDPQWTDINIVTGCLKLFLRELPDSVVPMRTFMSFIEAARLGSPAQRIAAIAARVKELPDPNYFTLKALVQHFRKVVDYGHVNKMQSTNMAIVFGPTLMRSPEGDSLGMAALLPVQNGIIELMIKEYNTIFRK